MYKVADSRIHRRGLFATKRIPKGTETIEYKGKLITKEEAEKRAEIYDRDDMVLVFELNDKYDIDGGVDGNDARFINHSCHPNCEAINYDEEEIWFVATKDIKPGEELTYDYGFDDEAQCRCGANGCRGKITTN